MTGQRDVELVFRSYEPSDAQDVVRLFAEAFGKHRNLREWNWLYLENPYGQSSIVCMKGEELVGFYGVIHRRVFLNGREFTAGHVVDVMTAPRHQGKGIFTNCAREAFSRARANGVELLFGFPNKLAIPGHEKVNWRFLGRMQILRCNLPLADRKLGCSCADQEVIVTSWDEFEKAAHDIDEINIENSMRWTFFPQREWKWLHWRYSIRPGVRYSPTLCIEHSTNALLGWAVLGERSFNGSKVGHIVDYSVGPRGGARLSLMHAAIDYFESEECDYVQCLENPGAGMCSGPDDLWESESGRELPFIMRTTDEQGLRTPQIEESDCYLALGDCDVF